MTSNEVMAYKNGIRAAIELVEADMTEHEGEIHNTLYDAGNLLSKLRAMLDE